MKPGSEGNFYSNLNLPICVLKNVLKNQRGIDLELGPKIVGGIVYELIERTVKYFIGRRGRSTCLETQLIPCFLRQRAHIPRSFNVVIYNVICL